MVFSIRDLLLWVSFINITTDDGDDSTVQSKLRTKLDATEAYIHGAHLVFLDRLGAGSSGNHA